MAAAARRRRCMAGNLACVRSKMSSGYVVPRPAGSSSSLAGRRTRDRAASRPRIILFSRAAVSVYCTRISRGASGSSCVAAGGNAAQIPPGNRSIGCLLAEGHPPRPSAECRSMPIMEGHLCRRPNPYPCVFSFLRRRLAARRNDVASSMI